MEMETLLHDDLAEIYQFYISALLRGINEYSNKEAVLRLPIVPKTVVEKICKQMTTVFKNEPIVLEISSDPLCVVGDLHGHILDLFRILKRFGSPPRTRYLFLGDIVDRGEFSIETIIFVYVMKLLFPNDIYIIRGNHEFAEVCDHSGFLGDISSVYNSEDLFTYFTDSFEQMPLAAVIDKTTIAVHGGIGPTLHDISEVEKLQRPIKSFSDNDIIQSLVWSDPSEEKLTESGSGYAPSPRGYGYLFDNDSFNSFMEKSGFDHLLRGHQCVVTGCESMYEDRLTTVFSASHYCGSVNNNSGIFLTKPTGKRSENFKPLPYLRRNNAAFVESEKQDSFIISKSAAVGLSDRAMSLSNQRVKIADYNRVLSTDIFNNNNQVQVLRPNPKLPSIAMQLKSPTKRPIPKNKLLLL